jgi:hypothetical protein
MYTSGSNKFGDTIDDTHQFTGSVLINGTLTATGISGSFNIPDSSTLQVGSQIFYPQGNNGFSVNEDFDASNNSSQTAYHYTSGAGRSSVVFTLARTGQFTNGFGISGSSSNNTFISFGEQSNTNFEWRKGVGIQPVNLSGGTLLAKLDTNGKFWATSISSSTGITGSIAATNGVISGSSQLTSSYDARYALSGSSAGTGPNTFDFNLDPEAAGTVNFIEDSTGNTQAISKTGSFDIEIGGTNHLSISSSAINVTTGSITANYMHLAKYITIEGHLDFNI